MGFNFDGVQVPANYINALVTEINNEYGRAFDATRDADTTIPEAQKVAFCAHALAVARDPQEMQGSFRATLEFIADRAMERLREESNK
jgi:hypothetical protein